MLYKTGVRREETVGFLPRRPIGLPSPLPSLGCPRTLGSSSLRLPGGSLPSSSSSSRALRRHPSVLSPGSPPGKFGPGRLAEPPPQAPCRSVPALQHVQIGRTLLFTSSEASRMCCLTSGKSRPQGLATLSTAYQPSQPLEASFSPQRSWAFSFRALLLPSAREKVSLSPAALALPYQPFRPGTRAPTVQAHPKSRPPFAPGGLVRVGGIALLEFRPLRLSPHLTSTRELSPRMIPLVLSTPRPSSHGAPGPQGLPVKRLGSLPP
jgi:hypothetical protein